MKPNKKKLKPLRHPAGPEGLRSGPRAQRGTSEVSIYFFVRFHETTQGFNFILRKISVKPLKPSKISMKPGHKKNAWFLFKTISFLDILPKYSWNHQKLKKKNQWNQVTKKMRGLRLKLNFQPMQRMEKSACEKKVDVKKSKN